MRASLKQLAGSVGSSVLGMAAVTGTLFAIALPQASPVVDEPWGDCTYEMRGVVGSPCWSAGDPISDSSSALQAAAEVAALTEGMECWDPSTGRVGSQIVVRDSETQVVSVIPFTVEAYERAVAGEFSTLLACEVA